MVLLCEFLKKLPYRDFHLIDYANLAYYWKVDRGLLSIYTIKFHYIMQNVIIEIHLLP